MTSDLGRVTTFGDLPSKIPTLIAVTSDLGRVTTYISIYSFVYLYNCGDVRSRTSYNRECCDYLRFTIHCGDVRSRTSYNFKLSLQTLPTVIAVTSDLGRVTTDKYFFPKLNAGIAVTSDLGRVTTCWLLCQRFFKRLR